MDAATGAVEEAGMKRIIRVFPRRTSYTPDDAYVFIGMPPFVIPEHDEVHISCTFSWDKEYARELQYQWEGRTDKPVKLGGVAFGSPAEDFTPGLYIKSNIIFTTRGCNNGCPWCIVPRQEGRLKELPIYPRNWIRECGLCGARYEQSGMIMTHYSETGWVCGDCFITIIYPQLFPDARIREDAIDIGPCCIENNKYPVSTCKTNCTTCRREYWSQEVE